MIEFSHQRNLAQDSLAVNIILKNIFYTLYCYFAAGRHLNRPTYASVAACTKYSFHYIVWPDLPVGEMVHLDEGVLGDALGMACY
jgi:hypothetical protein